ncbi:MAG: hypothetical protein OXN89_15065 [Bryobacterales bacterium]|nr:hypothetical protein [Bryobacterales bacterium]
MQLRIAMLGALVAGLFQASALASGSIAAGRGISPRIAYTQGKAVTFKKLVCASCPLQKADLNRQRAASLKYSLEARDAAQKPGTSDDEHIQVLCPGTKAVGCDSDVDEQELVHYYLTRRYKL